MGDRPPESSGRNRGLRILDFGECWVYKRPVGARKEENMPSLHKARPFSVLLLALSLLLAMPQTVRGQAQTDLFDHYVLALTWMPAFCRTEGQERDDRRCARDARLGWMVHGLWPQHADGRWPEYCASPHPNPSRQETARQSDLFGASGAAWHQWNKHGRCTGLPAPDYYALTRRALNGLTLPQVFDAITTPLRLAPQVIEEAFIDANPTLDASMMITTCREGALAELRLCLTPDLTPRPCAAGMLARSCPLNSADLLAPG